MKIIHLRYQLKVFGNKMTTPFDFVKSITSTKESLMVDEDQFESEYTPFVVNRILANSERTILFTDAVNRLPHLTKKMQYLFYMKGIPVNKQFVKYIKKEDSDVNQDHLKYICDIMDVSYQRALELYSLIGIEVVQKELDVRSGRK